MKNTLAWTLSWCRVYFSSIAVAACPVATGRLTPREVFAEARGFVSLIKDSTAASPTRYAAPARIEVQNGKLETRCGLSISPEYQKLISAVTIVVLSATAAVSGTIDAGACSGANMSNLAMEQKSDGMISASRLPLPAPIGHRQPRTNDVPVEDQATVERDRWLDKKLDLKLRICRGC
jgi:hypothetical protein